MTPHVDRRADGALRVLLLEDSAFDAELLGESLRSWRSGIELTWVQDEQEFIAALAASEFDVLLSDFQLGVYSGLQALEHAQLQRPDTPFIFVSGVIGEENAVELLKRGATDYVIKGRLARLPIAIERAIAEVAQRRARRDAEEQLRDADALYARVVDSLQDYAVLLLGKGGDVLSVNRAGQFMFGYDDVALVGRGVERLFTETDVAAHVLPHLLSSATSMGSAQDSRWLLRADGSTLRGDVVITPLFGSSGAAAAYSMLVRDTTASYREAQALQAAKDEAERANEAKDRFLAVLSHELRTPLTPIVAAAHVLERQAVVPERHAHLLPMIRRNVALESRLISDLLDITAISSGKLTLQKQRVALHPLIHAVMDMLDSEISAKAIVPRLALDAASDIVDGDEARLQQVVWNIVRNAVKFTPKGGDVSITTSLDGGEFRFACVDSGIGISAEALPRIFTAFEQADVSVRHRFGGLGLGLSIARALTLEHGGDLHAASPGRDLGAVFELRLPLAAALPPLPASAPASGDDEGRDDAGVAPGAGAAALHLLLVEDNPDSASALTAMLGDFGYEVRHAGTLREAGDLLGRERFDIVLTDLGLPDGHGTEIQKHVPDRVPVVALSGFGTPRDLLETAKARFAGHVVKPADPQVLREAIASSIERARKLS